MRSIYHLDENSRKYFSSSLLLLLSSCCSALNVAFILHKPDQAARSDSLTDRQTDKDPVSNILHTYIQTGSLSIKAIPSTSLLPSYVHPSIDWLIFVVNPFRPSLRKHERQREQGQRLGPGCREKAQLIQVLLGRALRVSAPNKPAHLFVIRKVGET